MKKYNKILEAVNKGILFALDDFEDDDVLNIKSKQVLNRDYTKEYLDLLRDEVVDLGLPSGTLWCKYNLGVNPNLLSKAEDWYGKYYAWDEIEANKPKYNWGSYKFGIDYNKLTKYCNSLKHSLYGFTDNLTELLHEDDAAYLNKKFYNFKFRIPTKELCEELLKYTNIYWVNNYDPNKTIHNPKNDKGIKRLNGMVFEGLNGNLLFISTAGCRNGSDIYSVGSRCYLWSSSLELDCPSGAYFLYFGSNNIVMSHYYRCFGYSVRPIIKL